MRTLQFFEKLFVSSLPVLVTACSAQGPVLHPLDEVHAAAFRRAFDEARDRPRYVVGLSPT